MDEAGLGPVARAAHAAWVAERAAWAAASVRGPGQHECLAIARRERANIDAALAWAAVHDPELGVRIADGFGWTWAVLGDGAAGAARLRDALAASSRAEPAQRLDGLLLATLAGGGGRRRRAGRGRSRAGRPAGGRAGRGDPRGRRRRADVLRHLAFVRIQQGRPADALGGRRGQPGARTGRWVSPGRRRPSANLAAFALAALGDTARAGELAEEALQIRTALGDAWGVLHAEAMLGAIASTEGRLEEAAARLGRAVAGAERSAFRRRPPSTSARSGASSGAPATPRRPPAPCAGRSRPPPTAATGGWWRRAG